VQQVKGAVLKSRLGFVERHFGAEGLQRLLTSLSPQDQKALRAVITVKWYPFALGERLDDAIVRVLAAGDQRFFERLGEASAETNLTTVHQSFLTPGNPHAFLSKAANIYRLYYESGRREYERLGERAAALTTRDAEAFSAPDCLTVVGWYRKALEMCGAAGVDVVEEECRARGGNVCRYRVSWRSP
jgi:uncharacterized protein (TIGR02265 family)